MIQRGVAAQGAEVFFHPIAAQPEIGACIKHEVAVEFIFQARRRHDRVERPLRRKFPANAAPGQNGILAQRIDPEPKDDLKAGVENVGAADDARAR